MYCVQIKLHQGAYIDYYVCPVANAVLTGDKNALECFLRYGYGVNEFKMEKFNALYYSLCGQRCMLGQKCSLNPRRRPRKCQRKENLFNISDSHSEDEDETTAYRSPRQHIVNEVLVFLLKLSTIRSPRYRSNLIECFHSIWRSRPTPYVKVGEILEIINQDWTNLKCPFQCWRTVSKVSELYVQEFKETAEGPVTPRSLRQLCRCTLRKSVMKSYSWEDGIQGLNLPKRMISYLKLEF